MIDVNSVTAKALVGANRMIIIGSSINNERRYERSYLRSWKSFFFIMEQTGIEEAVLFLRKGDKAHIIIPSHLAFGLLGDQKMIPSRSALIYEVNIINLK